MRTMAATAAASSANKRKPSFSDESDSDSDSPSSPSKKHSATSTAKQSASQQLVPVPGQPDAPLVTKRTLQNRKAQREFRKRREARVRELEERCRRFDQMGLEANTELQRLARNLKEENEALKSLIARLGFAHMIPGVLESVTAHDQHHPHQIQHSQHAPSHHHPQSFAPLDLGMEAWARQPAPASSISAPPLHQLGAPVPASALDQNSAATAPNSKQSKRSRASTSTTNTSASAAVSSLSHMPAFTELLPTTAGNVNPSLLSDTSSRTSKHSLPGTTAAIAIPATNKSTTTARPIHDNSTFDNDWFAQLAQSGHDKDDADLNNSATKLEKSTNSNTLPNDRTSINPILSLNLGGNNNNNNNNDSKPNAKPSDALNANSALTGSAMLGANARDFGLGLASALGIPASSAPGSNIFPMPMPTHQNGALLNPNPIPFAFNLSDNKAPGDQSWWSQVAGSVLEGDDSVLDEKAQAVAQATGTSNNGAPSPFDLSAFLNGGLTPGGGFTFGSQSNNDADDANDPQKSSSASSATLPDDAVKPNNGKAGETQSLTQAEHAQMFLRLLEAKMVKRDPSPYAQLGFQPPMHQQQYAASHQAGPSFSDASSSSSASSSSNDKAAFKQDDDSSLSPINVYSRLAQHPAFLSTNASELEELVDSISSSQHQRQQSQSLFQSPFNKRRASPAKPAPALYPPSASGLTPSIYGPNGAAALASRSSSSASSHGGKELEVDENAVTKMLGLLDRKTSREAATAGGGGIGF